MRDFTSLDSVFLNFSLFPDWESLDNGSDLSKQRSHRFKSQIG